MLGFIIFDPMYILLVMLPGLAIGLWAQAKVRGAYAQASKMRAQTGYSGADAAREILSANGISDVRVEQTQGWLSDHYDPRSRVLRLSPQVFSGRSLAALGIAAHEAGHAIQHARNYAPLTLRNSAVPMASIGSWLSFPLVFLGLLINMSGLMLLGILLFGGVVLFQMINLPCEYNASSRAREQLLDLGLVSSAEDATVRKVLNAAALTYVAAVVTALLNLMYYVMLFMGGRE
jgi:hypothetical protein